MTETPTASRFPFTIATPTASIVVIAVALVVTLLATLCSGAYIVSSEPSFWFIPFIFLVGTAVMAFYIRRLFAKYTVDEEGFLKHGQGDTKERVLAWRDIREIRPQRGGGEGVELLDGQGNAAVKIHGALAGYEKLIELLPQMRPDLWDFQGERTYQKMGDLIFLAVFALFFGGLGIFVGDLSAIVPKLIFFGVALFILWLLWGTPYKLTLRPGELELVSVQGTKRYSTADVQGIRVERHRSRNRISYIPTIDLADGKKLYAAGFGGGAANIYGALLRWWERGR